MYWIVFCCIIFILTSKLNSSGSERKLVRWKLNKNPLSRNLKFSLFVAFILWVLLGGYIYYQTNIVNSYWSKTKQQNFRVAYEKRLKKFEYHNQPEISDVNLQVELYPQKNSYTINGTYLLTNNSDTNISDIHIQKLLKEQVKISNITFDIATKPDSTYLDFGYLIYSLEKPLKPKESIAMEFTQKYSVSGLNISDVETKIIKNGTFFNNKDLPTLGYNRKYEISNAKERQQLALAPRKIIAKKSNQNELQNAVNGDDGYKINFEIVIGTDKNQTAIAPGTLVKKWEKDNRSYFHYKMEEPMVNFYSIVSATYEVSKSIWKNKNQENTALEIYYQKGHEYNINRMMESMQMSLDYYTTNFSPYPYQQIRIMEIPRYTQFAQSLPTSIPFSEDLGFMLDIDDTKDVDMAFYITAHELAHQWWGLQVAAANVQGRHMILETLAQYSAIMVLKQKYSKEKIQQFLKKELEIYWEDKGNYESKEKPLIEVENEDHIYYRKGVLVMHALQAYIGEDKVNLALRNFIKDWNLISPSFFQEKYPTTEDLMQYLKEVTPDMYQNTLTDLLEKVTIYDCKILDVICRERNDKNYELRITVGAKKYHILENGTKQVAPLKDWIDIEIYGENADGSSKIIALKEYKLDKNKSSFTILLSEKPSKVSIDPYYKLIEKNTTDNQKQIWFP
ncbi:M1 family metallopeptidase [Tenacibaculum sp. SG-28]|uniref:M1 family metallopeptidase n=1 Tax=Tenacibaculum sp. SG-28 TaxID=754426 RepID=UPI000D43C43E|nr:M1 family aminopeptidase [Tenacibaculum sp. SG-28]PQJ20813.1 hypothetical protein BSU00_11110 [Tenacibaculum sp. SG-28]